MVEKFNPKFRKANSHLSSVVKLLKVPEFKRSQGHVEMILTTVLFIGALIFIFIFLRSPFQSREISTEKVEMVLINNLSYNVGKLSVIVDSDNDCYNLGEVNDDYGNNFIEVHDSINKRKYTIYYGDFFDSSLIGKISCSSKNSDKFKLGVYTKEKIITKNKIQNLKIAYDDYAILKEALKIEDFSFQFKNLNNEIITELSVNHLIPENINVASNDIPVRVIDEKGNILELILNIKTWR